MLNFSKEIYEYVKNSIIYSKDDAMIYSAYGRNLKWLMDLRPLFLDPSALAEISSQFLAKFSAQLPFQVGAMETASIPVLAAILLEAQRLGIPLAGFIVRKERKKTGRGKWIEGTLTDAPIIMIDDTLNSGDSMDIARQALASEGREIRDVFVVVDFRSRKGVAWRDRNNIAVHSMFTLAEFGLSVSGHSGGNGAPVLETRSPIWSHRTKDGSPFHMVPKSAALIVGENLYFGTDKADFVCLDTATGLPRWVHAVSGTFRNKGIWSSPCYHDGRIYFGAYNGDTLCLDAQTGAVIWKQSLCEWIGSSPVIVAKHGLLVIGLEYERPGALGSIVALSLETGEKIWENWLTRYQHGSGCYWEQEDLIIIGTSDHEMVALKASTGEAKWSFATRRSVKYAPALHTSRGLVAFASFDQSIYILDARTGEKRFEIETDGICYTTPLFVDNHLVCGSGDRHVYVINVETMKAVKRIDARARVFSSPRLIGNKIFFGTCGGLVCEMNRKTFSVEKMWRVNDAITNAIACSEDEKTLFVPTYMNEVYAYSNT